MCVKYEQFLFLVSSAGINWGKRGTGIQFSENVKNTKASRCIHENSKIHILANRSNHETLLKIKNQIKALGGTPQT